MEQIQTIKSAKEEKNQVFNAIFQSYFLPLFTDPEKKGRIVNEFITNRAEEVILNMSNNGKSERRIYEHEYLTQDEIQNFCELLAKQNNVLFNERNPSLSCSIPNTRYRVNALHKSITADGEYAVCIRVPSDFKFDLEKSFLLSDKCEGGETNLKELRNKRSKNNQESNDEKTKYGYEDLRRFMREGANILISGGTGSGKTSFLNSLIDEIPQDERIISIEDSPELNLERFYNRVRIVVTKKETGFTYEDGLNNAMRMTPQRLMVGELDTRNISLFLRLGNTGHKGLVSTIHADSVDSIFEAISLNLRIANKTIDNNTLASFIKSSIDYFVQIVNINGTRYIDNIVATKDLFRV